MMRLFISILSLGLFDVMGTPQLKLGHSGYELISINDQNPDESVPLSSKLTLESATRYSGIGTLNLEKVTDLIDDDDGLSTPLQQHKRHYDPQRSTPGAKVISESQSNMIDITNKQPSNKKSNIYLTLGIPKSFTHPTTAVKETQKVIPISEKANQNSQLKDSYDDSDSLEESGNPQKVNAKSVQSKISDKRSKPAAKLSKPVGNTSEKTKNQESENMSSAILESEFELADLKDGEKITTLMADAHRAWDFIDTKSEFQNKQDKIEPPTVKSGFTMVTHFPSIQIHHQRSSFVSHKTPAMFSPIYPSGFDVIAGNLHKKSAVPVKELHGRHLRNDHKTAKSSKEFGSSYAEKTGQRIPSVLVLNNMNHDHSDPRIGNIMPFPISGTNLNVQPILKQKSFRPMRQTITHLEINSIPLATNNFDRLFPTAGSAIVNPQGHWEKIMPRYTIDLAKRHQQNNDVDRENLESNHVIPNSELKVDFLKNYIGKMSLLNEQSVRHVESANQVLPSNIESSKGLIIGIVHEVAPDDSEETIIDVKKEDANGETREMHDVSHPHSSASPKNSCKQMKPSTPAFYQFLTKLTNTVLGKALEYESDNQAQSSALKNFNVPTSENLDDIFDILG